MAAQETMVSNRDEGEVFPNSSDAENFSINICRSTELFVMFASPSYKHFAFAINGILTTVCAIFGVAGNLYSAYFLQQGELGGKKLSKSLAFLAIWDCVLLIGSWFYFGFSGLVLPNYPNFAAYLTLVAHPVITVSYVESTWFTILITVQRYCAVCHPMMIQRSRFGRLSIQVWISIIVMVLLGSTLFEFYVAPCWDSIRNETSTDVFPTNLRLDTNWQSYRIIHKVIFCTVAPFLLISVLSIRIIIKMRQSNKERYRLVHQKTSVISRQAELERFTAFMLISIMIKFILSHLLPVLMDIWEVFHFEATLVQYKYAVDVSNAIVVLNSATNSFIYLRYKHVAQTCMGRRLFRFTIGRRPRTAKNHTFKKAEADCLMQSYRQVFQNHMGARILKEVIGKKPALCAHLDLDDSVPDQWLQSPKLQALGGKIDLLFFHVVQALHHEWEWKFSGQDKEVQHQIKAVGYVHYKRGIVFSTEAWRAMKCVVLREILNNDEIENREQTTEAWSKLVSFVIHYMKIGFFDEAKRHGGIRATDL